MTGRYVLVVEDDADVREMLCEVIEEAGYRVAAAADGRDALAFLRSHPPPVLILLDLMMPVTDGREFLALQRKDPAIAAIPAVVLSAEGRLEPVGELQGTPCLKKPIDLDELLSTIEKYHQAPRDDRRA